LLLGPEISGEVILDPQKLKQVLYNLLSNAVKFTDQGGRVEVQATLADKRWVKLRIQDTGIGIKAEDLPRLFRAFEQLEAGASRRFEGTGLGLALTKRLVELQGGRIEVESHWGKGSAFTVVLPLSLPVPIAKSGERDMGGGQVQGSPYGLG
jgi:signal transduction histidine kinase